jgi:hypothetical protein
MSTIKKLIDSRLIDDPKNIFEKLFHYNEAPESWYELGYKLGWCNLNQRETLALAKKQRLDEFAGCQLLKDAFDDQMQITADLLLGWNDGHGDQMAVRVEYAPLFDKYFLALQDDNYALIASSGVVDKLQPLTWK